MPAEAPRAYSFAVSLRIVLWQHVGHLRPLRGIRKEKWPACAGAQTKNSRVQPLTTRPPPSLGVGHISYKLMTACISSCSGGYDYIFHYIIVVVTIFYHVVVVVLSVYLSCDGGGVSDDCILSDSSGDDYAFHYVVVVTALFHHVMSSHFIMRW